MIGIILGGMGMNPVFGYSNEKKRNYYFGEYFPEFKSMKSYNNSSGFH